MLLLVPQLAWAQRVPEFVLILLLVPVANMLCAWIYGLISKSARRLSLHSGLVFLWLVLFWFFASFTSSDFLAWLPVGLSLAHGVWLVVACVGLVVARARTEPEDRPRAGARSNRPRR